MREYYDWWARQMLDLVPERLRTPATAELDALTLYPASLAGDGSLRLVRDIGGGSHDLGTFAPDRAGFAKARAAANSAGRARDVRLAVPADLLLEKTLTLPTAAERGVERVLAYEMDRETPFGPEEVWWSWELTGRDRAHDRLTVRLSLVQREPLEEILALLDRESTADAPGASLRPTALLIPLPEGGVRQIPLEGAAHGADRGVWQPQRFALVALALLAVLVLVVPFLRQSWAIASVEQRIADLKPAAEQAEALRRRLEGAGVAGQLAHERTRLGDPLTALATVTRILPDDTYLTDFTMQERRLTLNGQSSGAAKLIGLLAAESSLKGPAFAAPITRIEGSHTEGFSITAEARP